MSFFIYLCIYLFIYIIYIYFLIDGVADFFITLLLSSSRHYLLASGMTDFTLSAGSFLVGIRRQATSGWLKLG